ncbi:MAG: hypothetical protein V4513_06695 [Pseudomonadota bacterium]
MARLSISQAWDESRQILSREGGLLSAVALALVALPMAIFVAFVPGGVLSALTMAAQGSSGHALGQIALFLVFLLGQLSVTRLALGPSVSVGGAIAAASRRAPSYIGAALIIGIAIMIGIFAISILVVLAAQPASQEAFAKSPAMMVTLVAICGLYLFMFARVISVAPAVATSEPDLGPIGIIRRSWSLTGGHFWRIAGFLVLFFVATSIAMAAIGLAIGSAVEIAFGDIDPMSASALVVGLVEGLATAVITVTLMVMLARIYVQLAGGAVSPSVPSSGT